MPILVRCVFFSQLRFNLVTHKCFIELIKLGVGIMSNNIKCASLFTGGVLVGVAGAVAFSVIKGLKCNRVKLGSDDSCFSFSASDIGDDLSDLDIEDDLSDEFDENDFVSEDA